MTTNLGRTERLLTMAAGVGTIALSAWSPRARRPLAVASAALLARAATGYCPVTARLAHADTNDTRRALGGPRGAHVEVTETIAADAGRVYECCRDPLQLAQALPPHIELEALDALRWQWSLATADVPHLATWTTQIINEIPGQLLAWKSVRPSALASAGSITLTPSSTPGSTDVTVRLQYALPTGALSDTIALWCHGSAHECVGTALRRIKQLVELEKES